VSRPPSHPILPRRIAAIAIGVVAAAAGGIAGCGAGVASAPIPPTRTIPSVTGKAVNAITGHRAGRGTGAAATDGSTTSTDQVVVPGAGKPTILLGDMNTPEQFILGQLYRLALRAQGYTVSLSRNIGPTAISVEAMKEHSLDIYPEYLNVWDTSVADVHRSLHSLHDAYRVGQVYASRQKMKLLAPTPFSDTSGIAVLSSYAQRHRLQSLIHLSRVARRLTFGGPLEFTHGAGGLPTVEHEYGFRPAAIQEVAIGAQYVELQSGTIEAAYVSTSDPQLSAPNFRVLADPEHIFGFGNVVPVVSDAALKAEGPQFARTINRVDALLTETAIRGLNAEVQVAHDDPEAVAEQFLEGNGLLPPPVYSTTT
jgi:osmoprotectant transport system substrate-binding protein